MKGLLPNLIADFQNSFIPGRMMVDNCYVASELLHYVKKKRKGKYFAGILKVDISKAYDRVRWDFLKDTLIAMAFPDKWVQLIMQCVSSVTCSVLVNGEATAPFHPTTDLHQGDPLFPYLFIFCMGVLPRRLSWLQYKKKITGLHVARSAPSIPHLFFC